MKYSEKRRYKTVGRVAVVLLFFLYRLKKLQHIYKLFVLTNKVHIPEALTAPEVERKRCWCLENDSPFSNDKIQSTLIPLLFESDARHQGVNPFNSILIPLVDS